MSYFEQQAKFYAEFRPSYPAALFDFIAAAAPGHKLAWDCATGSGQAAQGLAPRFARVIATDISPQQIAHARPHANIEYRVAPAESSGLEAHSADAVTVTQALHWLRFEEFYSEVRRVLAPGGIVVATVYTDAFFGEAALDKIFLNYSKVTVGPYWPPERHHVDCAYSSIPFPFGPIPSPQISLQRECTLAEFAGYMRSWSATVRYVKAKGVDPVTQVEEEMRPHWGDPARRRAVRWPFFIKAGRVPA